MIDKTMDNAMTNRGRTVRRVSHSWIMLLGAATLISTLASGCPINTYPTNPAPSQYPVTTSETLSCGVTVSDIFSNSKTVSVGGTLELWVSVQNPEGILLEYNWLAVYGKVEVNPIGTLIRYTAPSAVTKDTITLMISAEGCGEAKRSTQVLVIENSPNAATVPSSAPTLAAIPPPTVSGEGPVVEGDITIAELNSQPIGSVWQLAWSPDGSMLAVALMKDATVKLYSVPDLNPIIQCNGHTEGVRSVAFSPDGSTLVSGGSDNVVRVWKLDSFNCTPVLVLPHKSAVISVMYQPTSSELIATGSDDGTISLWRVASGELLRRWGGDPVSVPALAFSPDGQTLASGGSDALIHLWTLDGTEVRQLKGHTGWIWDIAFGPDGTVIASAGTGNLYDQQIPPDNMARLWRVRDGLPLQELPSGSHYVMSVSFSHDGSYLATGSRYEFAPTSINNLRFWRVSDGRFMGEGKLTDAATFLRFSPDGSMLAVGTSRSVPWGQQKDGWLYVYQVR